LSGHGALQVQLIWRLNHRNLVSLLGWCAEKGEHILVYELVEGGSLQDYFNSTVPDSAPPGGSVLTQQGLRMTQQPRRVLSPGQRLRVALGAAQGLQYLHENAQHSAVHCDVKPSNILITADLTVSRMMTSACDVSL
jgi:serine/threonine protein kinase